MTRLFKTGLSALAVIAVSAAMMSCQGRTMKNMEPTGETVEVSVSDAPEADADTTVSDSTVELN